MIEVRLGGRQDLAAIEAIQRETPAAQWEPQDYLTHLFYVAEAPSSDIAGFIVYRQTGPGELEILNLAVASRFRRRGIATALMEQVNSGLPGCVFLEVRESNGPARKFYERLGFSVLGVRPNYYHDPVEPAIVMGLQR